MEDKRQIKVLWLSRTVLSTGGMSASGTWVAAMASALLKYHPAEVQIFNIADKPRPGQGSRIICEQVGPITQWILPRLPARTLEDWLGETIAEIAPDLIHLWGTETILGDFPFASRFPHIPVLLEMQGLIRSVAEVYFADLTPWQKARCFRLKELLKPSKSSFAYRRQYYRDAQRESRMIAQARYISVQSDWMQEQVRNNGTCATIFRTDIALRPQFYTATPWTHSIPADSPSASDSSSQMASSPSAGITVFTTASTIAPYKGLLTLVRAFDIVHRHHPQARLRIAGEYQRGLLEHGYSKLIRETVSALHLDDAVEYLGPLDADGLIRELQSASVFVNPSFIESYSLVLAEAMMIGTPCVASDAGAMPELSRLPHTSSPASAPVDSPEPGGPVSHFPKGPVSHFPKGDIEACARAILDILSDPAQARRMSALARHIAQTRNDSQKAAVTQLDIYRKIL